MSDSCTAFSSILSSPGPLNGWQPMVTPADWEPNMCWKVTFKTTCNVCQDGSFGKKTWHTWDNQVFSCPSYTVWIQVVVAHLQKIKSARVLLHHLYGHVSESSSLGPKFAWEIVTHSGQTLCGSTRIYSASKAENCCRLWWLSQRLILGCRNRTFVFSKSAHLHVWEIHSAKNKTCLVFRCAAACWIMLCQNITCLTAALSSVSSYHPPGPWMGGSQW